MPGLIDLLLNPQAQQYSVPDAWTNAQVQAALPAPTLNEAGLLSFPGNMMEKNQYSPLFSQFASQNVGPFGSLTPSGAALAGAIWNQAHPTTNDYDWVRKVLMPLYGTDAALQQRAPNAYQFMMNFANSTRAQGR